MRQDDGWIVEGTASLYQLRLELNEPDLLMDAEQLTIGGYLIAQLTDMPEVNQSVTADGYRFTILQTTPTRITLVKVEPVLMAISDAD